MNVRADARMARGRCGLPPRLSCSTLLMLELAPLALLDAGLISNHICAEKGQVQGSGVATCATSDQKIEGKHSNTPGVSVQLIIDNPSVAKKVPQVQLLHGHSKCFRIKTGKKNSFRVLENALPLC